MLKKIYKLKSLEIKNLFNKKETPFKVIRGVFFDIKIFKNLKEESFESKDFIKSTVIVSHKVSKRAVDRNKLKRQSYTIIENFLKENKNNTKETKTHINMVIYPKKEALNIKLLDLKKELYNSLNILN